MRAPNGIDFWRGFALVTIFVDHIPGIFYENYTIHNVAISDAAELFVFLAGWSLRLLVESMSKRVGFGSIFLRLEGRAITIFSAQIVITEVALAITAAGALWLDSPLILGWNNASSIFENPIETHLGLVLLTHQLFFFDILPLYVVLMAFAPLIVAINRLATWLLLPLSIMFYLVVLTSGINIPTWPLEGRWYFNPLAWQLVFVLGFVMASPQGVGDWVRRHLTLLRWAAVPILLVGVVTGLNSWAPDPLALPEPRLLLMFDKTFVSPARIVHLLAVVAVFSATFIWIDRFVPKLTVFLSMLGRNSLNVFCIGSLLSLLGQFARFVLGGTFVVDTLVVTLGIAAMSVTAWLSEWRERSTAR